VTGAPMDTDCPICLKLSGRAAFAENELCAAIWDAFPVSAGHCLIVPKRHEADYFALRPDEQRALVDLLREVWPMIDRDCDPSGYNAGINGRAAGGQTIPHVHLHLIHRFADDMEDPRGGVRWVLPARAAYWNLVQAANGRELMQAEQGE
jgi:diadenosine tetraphosphate (Ap4A) HIT family hydrolase